ncbi:MarR family winged helix-turn-helix transcriptional regulator [Rhabdothermincola sediminis]|uniref:MarR family winged helix-turn-helix transcriptional regulator n=1 Tax=Rhabdothermincola sediminis TaxID=2751370 RepID=UPI001AA02D9D|nr:MarR family transcriptional regulator [Rhabdothermincola sediminis]
MAAAEDDVSRLRMILLRLARRLRQQVNSGITPSQLSALVTIAKRGPLTLGELAAIENVQPPTISRIVGALEGEGWVERTSNERDRRISLVRATPAARRELEQIREERNTWLANRLATLSTGDRNHLLAALPALEQLLDEETP